MKAIYFTLILVLGCTNAVIAETSFISFAQKQQQAIETDNWHDAIANTIGMINNTRDNNISSSSFLQLGGLLWLSGNSPKAVSAIERSIHIMGHSSDIDMAMIAVAKKILQRIRNSSNTPSSREKKIVAYYIQTLSRSAARAQGYIDSAVQREIAAARHQMLMRRFDSQIASIKRESERFERRTKADARKGYWKSTGKTFDPSNRPRGGYAREQWDAAKRVYDIFDR